MKANMIEKEDKEGYIEDLDEMGVEDVGDGIDNEWNGEIVAEICYQISQDINQCQNKRKYKQFNEYKQYNRCQPYKPQNVNTPSHNAKKLRQKKFHILTTLDWQIHYTTFIDLTYKFFQNHKTTILQYMGKNKQRGLGRNRVYESREKQLQAEIQNQIQILLEQWVFLEKEAVQCAKVAVGRVLKEFELEVDCGQLGMFMGGEVQELVINIMKSQELQVDNVVQNDLEQIMQNLRVLKQVNRANSSITASSSSCLSSNSTSCFDFINNNKQINTPPPKLAQLRSKITLSQKTYKYFQPVSILTPQSSTLNSVLMQQNRGMQFIVSSSAPCTRHPSFQ